MEIRGKKLKNRIAFAPTVMATAGHEGRVTDQTLCHYTARAKGGAGLIIIEHTMSNNKFGLDDNGALCIHQDRNLPGMMDLANAVQAFDALAVVQLSIGVGRAAGRGKEPVGPSAMPLKIPENSMPKKFKMFEGQSGKDSRSLSISEIEEIENLYLDAVFRTKTAGFDGIEIHAAHGYLLASFLSPFTNKRDDEYGGSFENRIKFLIDLIDKSREKAGDDFIIGLRMSGDEHLSNGWTLNDTLKLIPIVEKHGVDYIHLSSGTIEAWKYTFPDKEGGMIHEAEAIKKIANIPVICPNIHDPALAAKAVQEGKTDIVSLSRSLLADPQWPSKVKDGKIDEIQKCCFCYGCLKTLMQGVQTRCSINPNVGRERFVPEYFPPPRKGSGMAI